MSISALDQDLTHALYCEDEEIANLLIETARHSENYYPDEDEERECNELHYESNDEFDWEKHMGNGYWDDDGGSSQWVPVESQCVLDDNEDYEVEEYWVHYDESLSEEEYHTQMNLELTWSKIEAKSVNNTM